jgi:hypothetical protein
MRQTMSQITKAIEIRKLNEWADRIRKLAIQARGGSAGYAAVELDRLKDEILTLARNQ